jgi:hypothetical protein
MKISNLTLGITKAALSFVEPSLCVSSYLLFLELTSHPVGAGRKGYC